MPKQSYKYHKTQGGLWTLIFVAFTLATGFSQNIQLILDDGFTQQSREVLPGELDSLIRHELSVRQAEGYWDTKIELISDSTASESILAMIITGEMPRLKHIHFQGLVERDQQYLKHEFLLGQPTIASGNVKYAENRVRSLGYQFAQERNMFIDSTKDYHLVYNIKERPELNIDLLAALNQSPNADTLNWFGHVNVYVPNLDGSGKSIHLNWKRLKANSEYLAVRYDQPWLFSLPLKGSLKFSREVVDGHYQIIQKVLGLDWSIDWDRSLIFTYEDYQSLITNEGGVFNPQWKSSQRRMIGLGYRQTNLDLSNHRGFGLRSSFDQELNFEPSSISRFNLRSEFEYHLPIPMFVSQRTSMVLQNSNSSNSDPSLLKSLGGLTSVRGYEENFLWQSSVMSIQNEAHLLLGLDSQLLALVDYGLYYDAHSLKFLTGYGIGVQLRTSRGPIRLILATHSGLEIRNSFLHIEYSRGLSWIDQ